MEAQSSGQRVVEVYEVTDVNTGEIYRTEKSLATIMAQSEDHAVQHIGERVVTMPAEYPYLAFPEAHPEDFK